jgi:hypothetical protein
LRRHLDAVANLSRGKKRDAVHVTAKELAVTMNKMGDLKSEFAHTVDKWNQRFEETRAEFG